MFASARAIALFGEFAFEIFVNVMGLAVLLTGVLIAVTGAMYRPLGWLAVLAGFLMLFHWLSFANEDLIWIARIGLWGTLLFFLVAGIVMIVRGTREAPAQ